MMDNRGVGRSGCLKARAAYTTTLMATDVLLLLVRSRTVGVSVPSFSICFYRGGGGPSL
jgi:hypothetical protein